MASKAKRLLQFLFSKQALSESLSWGLDRNHAKMRPVYESRNDIHHLEVGEGVRIEVFWKQLKLGKGPALSLFLLEEEVLRIDCFGKGAAHIHVAFFLPGKGEQRLWMHEQTVGEQISRARFELYRNYQYYQARVPDPKIRALKIDRLKMKEASEQAYNLLNGFLDSESYLNEGLVTEAYSDEID
ncbi:MAG: hypothetical protein O3C43_17490 [Verrucomicrobia bacterium]|nr:hypothetical protein [Verrucomicrobiota bacterium]MDA1068285.1 hypothetical protein [Verrucomicrobiota bacterium]